jgi:hypothetical protein
MRSLLQLGKEAIREWRAVLYFIGIATIIFAFATARAETNTLPRFYLANHVGDTTFYEYAP